MLYICRGPHNCRLEHLVDLLAHGDDLPEEDVARIEVVLAGCNDEIVRANPIGGHDVAKLRRPGEAPFDEPFGTGDKIDRAARRKRHEQPDRMVRIGLRRCGCARRGERATEGKGR